MIKNWNQANSRSFLSGPFFHFVRIKQKLQKSMRNIAAIMALATSALAVKVKRHSPAEIYDDDEWGIGTYLHA